MPHHRRLFRFRVLLSLSLAYGCAAPQAGTSPQPVQPSGSPLPPVASPSTAQPAPSAQPSPTPTPEGIRLLTYTEINQLRSSGLVAANNRFGWDLLAQVFAEDPGANHFLSPASAALALQMTLQGAAAETREQMRKTLHLTEISNETLLEHVPLLLRKLQRPAEDVTLEVANSLWANSRFRFFPDFLAAVRGPFGGEAEALDFREPEAIPRLNAWVEKTTHGTIKAVKPVPQSQLEREEMHEYTVAFLLNAVYFKGAWTRPFDKRETRERPFYLPEGQTKNVPMMRDFGGFGYHPASETFPHEGLVLPYGKTGRQAMYLFLPGPTHDLTRLLADLSKTGLEGVLPQFQTHFGSVRLPQIRFEGSQSLNQALMKQGMPLAFDQRQADLTQMAEPLEPKPNPEDDRLFIRHVDQFAFLEVDELGTEAAAVTVVEVGVPASSEPMSSLDIEFNRPFLLLIRDQDTEQILFVGTITDPQPR